MTFHFLSHISSFTSHLLYNETFTLNIVFFFKKNSQKHQNWSIYWHISSIYWRYIGNICQYRLFNLGAFFLKIFFTSLHFCVGFVLDISVNYQYIGDIERFFPIFPRNDFHLQNRVGMARQSIFCTIFNPGNN